MIRLWVWRILATQFKMSLFFQMKVWHLKRLNWTCRHLALAERQRMSSSMQKGKRLRSTKHRQIDKKRNNKFHRPKSPKNLKKSKSADNGDVKSVDSLLNTNYMVTCKLCRHDMYQLEMRKKNANWIPFDNGTMKEFKAHLKAIHSKWKVQTTYFAVIGEVDETGSRHYFISKTGGIGTVFPCYFIT